MAKSAEPPHRQPAETGCGIPVPVPDTLLGDALHGYSGYDKLAIQTILALKITAHRMENCATEWFDEYGLTPAKLNALLVLRSRGEEPMRLSEIGQYLFSTRANVTGLIDGLEREGLVARSANPGDRRSTLVALTDKGLGLLAEVLPRHFARVRRMTEGLSVAERHQLIELLAKLFNAFQAINASDSEGDPC